MEVHLGRCVSTWDVGWMVVYVYRIQSRRCRCKWEEYGKWGIGSPWLCRNGSRGEEGRKGEIVFLYLVCFSYAYCMFN